MQHQPAFLVMMPTACTQFHRRSGNSKRVMDSDYRRVSACITDLGATPRCSSLEESSLDQLLRGFSLVLRMQPRLFPGSDRAR